MYKQKEDLNLKYLKHLMKMFKKSRGNNISNFEEEFEIWLESYIALTQNYASFLIANDIDLSIPETAEFDKGLIDTVSEDITIISEFAPTMNKPKLIMGDVYRGLLIREGIEILSLDELGIETMLMQNSISRVNDFEVLAFEQRRRTIFGVYGYFGDEDSSKKIKTIKSLLALGEGNKDFIYDTNGDAYYLAIDANRASVKRKEKVKTL